MLQAIWDTRGYLFWLLVISLVSLLAERIRPWRQGQKLFRKQFPQDIFWLFFNGHYFAILFAHVTAFVAVWLLPLIESAKSWNVLGGQPVALQALVYFLLKDFLDWCVHNLLHRVPFLWEFHKLHHSIIDMDWIGSFRFHWMESVIYQGLTYLPLVVLGVDPTVILLVAIAATLIGELNHSNLDITWGPLRYVLNSPRMHVWHHDAKTPPGRPFGANFGISLSLWDWLFGTAHWPDRAASPSQQPERFGFKGIDEFPRGLLPRLVYPLSRPFCRKAAVDRANLT